MKKLYVAALAALLTSPSAWAQATQPSPELTPAQTPAPALVIQSADTAELSQFKWAARVLVVFADSPLDPSFREQIERLHERPAALIERDVVIFTDTDPDARSAMRRELRPRGFALVIVDKDGRVMLRKPSPWDVREIIGAIDRTPLRQQEIREAKEAARADG
nr:DUF4174 domain-containing protein [uncultured Celeribacter sp.]